MFNRNEWLQWAKQSQTSNPEMQDFRNEYWRKNDATRGYLYENSEQQVDEGLMKDLDKGFRSAGRWITGKKEGKPLSRKQLTDRLKQHYDKSKKVVVDKDTRDKAIAGLKSAGSHALVGAIYAKTGGPSKEEKEQQKKMSPTRLGTQQPEEPTKESVELDEFTVPGYDQDKTLKANMPKWRKDADKRTREQSKKVKVRKTRPLTNPMKPTDESVKIEEGGKDVVKIGEPITIGLDFKNTIGDKKNKKSRDSYLDRELAKILGTKKPKSGPKSKYPAGDHPGLDPDLELESVEMDEATKTEKKTRQVQNRTAAAYVQQKTELEPGEKTAKYNRLADRLDKLRRGNK